MGPAYDLPNFHAGKHLTVRGPLSAMPPALYAEQALAPQEPNSNRFRAPASQIVGSWRAGETSWHHLKLSLRWPVTTQLPTSLVAARALQADGSAEHRQGRAQGLPSSCLLITTADVILIIPNYQEPSFAQAFRKSAFGCFNQNLQKMDGSC